MPECLANEFCVRVVARRAWRKSCNAANNRSPSKEIAVANTGKHLIYPRDLPSRSGFRDKGKFQSQPPHRLASE
jgi:hypothetical protein